MRHGLIFLTLMIVSMSKRQAKRDAKKREARKRVLEWVVEEALGARLPDTFSRFIETAVEHIEKKVDIPALITSYCARYMGPYYVHDTVNFLNRRTLFRILRILNDTKCEGFADAVRGVFGAVISEWSTARNSSTYGPTDNGSARLWFLLCDLVDKAEEYPDIATAISNIHHQVKIAKARHEQHRTEGVFADMERARIFLLCRKASTALQMIDAGPVSIILRYIVGRDPAWAVPERTRLREQTKRPIAEDPELQRVLGDCA